MVAAIPTSTAWLLGACMEAKGQQTLWTRQKPEALEALREQAMVQSTESSNRIEGVVVEPGRLRPILLEGVKPRDRSETELVGYRKALALIFAKYSSLPVSPKTILHLHELIQGGGPGDAGQWKKVDNEIVELKPGQAPRVRFKATPAKDTPAAVEALCRAYGDRTDGEGVPQILASATFVFDFLCIHPFRDGNGRVSRLLTALLLLKQGFTVGRYVSLERLVEESREDYYRVLERCSQGWHKGKHDIVPWWNYFLGILNRAYGELGQQVQFATGPAKTELIRRAIQAQVGAFTLAEIQAACPAVSPQMIKKVLGNLKRDGKVRLTGHGRGARWENVTG